MQGGGVLDEADVESGEDGGEESGGGWRSGGGLTRRFGAGLIFLASLYLLFWNEGASKSQADALDQIGREVVVAPAGAIDPALEGRLVHVSGRVASASGARDVQFGLQSTGVALYRYVEMYQWIEFEETEGRGKNKRSRMVYELGWDSEYHDSSEFEEPAGHQNPRPALESESYFASDARLGPYRFDLEQVAEQALDEMGYAERTEDLGNWPQMIESLPEPNAVMRAQGWYRIDAGTYYKGNPDSDVEELGDLTANFFELRSDFPLSVIAVQSGDGLRPWTAPDGQPFVLAMGGTQDASHMVSDAQALNASSTKLLRILGLIGAVIGAVGVASWLGAVIGMIPLVGGLVERALMVVAAVFGLFAGGVAIVLGWLSARPWIAALVAMALAGLIVWAINRRRGMEATQRKARRIAEAAEVARQRAAERMALASGAPLPLPAGAPLAALADLPPAPAASSAPAAARTAAGKPPSVTEASSDLPPLEWKPSTRAVDAAAPEPAAPDPVRDATARVRAVAASSAPLPPVVGSPQAVAGGLPFETVEPRAAAPALFDTVAPRPASTEPALFETVEPRDAPRPRVAAPTPAKPAAVRVPVGRKGEFLVSRIVRRQEDGSEELVCFELSRGGQALKRGSKEDVAQALKAALAAAGSGAPG